MVLNVFQPSFKRRFLLQVFGSTTRIGDVQDGQGNCRVMKRGGEGKREKAAELLNESRLLNCWGRKQTVELLGTVLAGC